MKDKRIIMCWILASLSVISIRMNGSPKIYMGLVFAYIGVMLIGSLSNKKIGAIFGGASIGLGLIFRKLVPVIPNLNFEKFEEFTKQNIAYNQFLEQHYILVILLGILAGFLFGIVGEKIIREKIIFTTNRITYMAMFVALSVVINTLRVGEISFGGFPIIFGGYVLGPIYGFLIGAIADILGFVVRPSISGAFNPLFVLTSALTGLIPVLITQLLGERYPNYSFFKILIGILIGQLITSVILVPIFMVIFYGGNTFVYFALKALLKQSISIPLYAFLLTSVNTSFSKVIKINKR